MQLAAGLRNTPVVRSSLASFSSLRRSYARHAPMDGSICVCNKRSAITHADIMASWLVSSDPRTHQLCSEVGAQAR